MLLEPLTSFLVRSPSSSKLIVVGRNEVNIPCDKSYMISVTKSSGPSNFGLVARLGDFIKFRIDPKTAFAFCALLLRLSVGTGEAAGPASLKTGRLLVVLLRSGSSGLIVVFDDVVFAAAAAATISGLLLFSKEVDFFVMPLVVFVVFIVDDASAVLSPSTLDPRARLPRTLVPSAVTVALSSLFPLLLREVLIARLDACRVVVGSAGRVPRSLFRS